MNAHCLSFDIRIALLAAYLLVVALPPPVYAESTFDEEMRLFSELLSLRPGADVADIGAGEGDYALAVAEIVGETGAIYATELDEDKLEALRVMLKARQY